MKKNLLLVICLIISYLGKSQTILSGSETFGKDRKEGFYVNINIDDKFIKKDWETFLGKLGKVNSSKGIYTLSNAKLYDISADPMELQSKITGNSGKSTLFVAFDTGGGNMVRNSSTGYAGVEKLLKDFYSLSMYNEDVRLAVRDSEEAEKNADRVKKTGERIVKEIERNKKEKENLLKKIEENKAALEKLLKDQTDNAKDQENAKVALEEKKKAVEVVKSKQY